MEEDNRIFNNNTKTKFLPGIRNKMRTNSYSDKTISSYSNWIKRFIIFNGKHHPSELKQENIENFLTHLAVEKNVTASTQQNCLTPLQRNIQMQIKNSIGNTLFQQISLFMMKKPD